MTEEQKKKPTNVEDAQEMVRIASNKGIGNVGICTTAANTAAKEVTLGSTFELTSGATMIVTFQNAITVTGATIVVTHTPLGESVAVTEVAKPIYYRGAALGANLIKAGMMVLMRYNGTQWDIISNIEDLNDYLQVNAQNFTNAQKQQARTNIGAQENVTDMSKLGNGIGTCSTSSGTALEVVLSDYNLVKNGFVAVSFDYDVPASATMNINSKGAKAIYYKGAAIEADTIKADDTVMFAYDGTNYVVTSFGGGGSVVFHEFVTIQLTQSGGNDSDLIGATVVVTNDDTSATILSTTWDGSDIYVQVDGGVNYTVTVGNVSGLVIRQNTQSYTAVAYLSRTITFTYWGNFVDMGLPSGILWARKNLDATQPDGFAVSDIQYECSFFSWGNVSGHNPVGTTTFSYNFGSNNSGPYASTPGAALTGNIPENETYDIARRVIGSPLRLPTETEFQELFENSDFVQANGTTVITTANKLITLNGITGIYLKSKINSNLLFFPCSGYGENSTWDGRGTYGFYWASTLAATDKGRNLMFNSANVGYGDSRARYFGFSCKPVM